MNVRFCSLRFSLLVWLLVVSFNAFAHAPRENYVWINIEDDHISGRFELNVADIDNKLKINVDSNSAARLAGVADNAEAIQSYLLSNFSMSDSEGDIPISFVKTGLSAEAADFAQFFFKSDRLPKSDELSITNTVFLTPEFSKDDRLHRSLIVLEYNKAENKDFGLDTPFLVFSPQKSTATLDTVNPSAILEWKDFLVQGVLHIWLGLDHVLFVLVLLLSTVLIVKNGDWQPIDKFRSAFFKTLKIITIFTIAHSITLSLAAFGLVSINSAFIETVIAVSIIAVALNNLVPVFNAHAWILVFVFGLFHGLGFASVMADLQFRTGLMGHILLMFNVGVELGQFAIVALVFPLFFFMRKSSYYRTGVVIPISVLSILLATYWVIERTGLINYVA